MMLRCADGEDAGHADDRRRGRAVLDVGAGTGAASRAALAAGAARVVALDAAIGMLAHDAARRPPAVVGDARALPFARWSFDAAVAAFSLNHLADPAAGLREMARVIRPGQALVAAAYAVDDTHPVKSAVEAALAARGWSPEPWYTSLRTEAAPLLATPEVCAAAAASAGLDARVEAVRVPFLDSTSTTSSPGAWGWPSTHPSSLGSRLRSARQWPARRLPASVTRSRPLERSILVLSALSP